MSPKDRDLLAALFDPSSNLSATAAAHGLSLLDLAHWLTQPYIQFQIELIQSLRALSREIWTDHLRREVADALRDAMKSAPDPAERRRCASTVLRAISLPRVPRPRAEECVPNSTPRRRIAPRPQPTSAHERSELPDPAEPHAHARSTPASPVNLAAQPSVPPDRPISSVAPFPAQHDRSVASSPETLLSQALVALRACGYDIAADDDALDALEDEELDALDDAEPDEDATNLTDAGIADALSLADQSLSNPPDTS